MDKNLSGDEQQIENDASFCRVPLKFKKDANGDGFFFRKILYRPKGDALILSCIGNETFV